MKKIISAMSLVALFFLLSACTKLSSDIEFFGIKSFVLLQHSEKPDFLSGVSAFDKEGNDLTIYIEVDDQAVNMDVLGTYDVFYKVVYEDIQGEARTTVKVVSETQGDIDQLTTYYINDLHGALIENEASGQMGVSKIGNLILDEKTNKPEETIFIAGGDMLQGQLISNYFKGESTIRMLNEMQLDAFIVGNHEFDWGFETVLGYFNGKHSLQANYPLLAANIIENETNQMPNGVEPYVILNKGNTKVGIIGVIGQLESSISYEFVKDYTFTHPATAVKKYANELRSEHLVDVVIVAIHDENQSFNTQVSSLTGMERVDVIFNAHSHRAYELREQNIPIIQSGSSGSHVGKVVLKNENNAFRVFEYQNLDSYDDPRLNIEHQALKALLNEYYMIVEALMVTPIAKTVSAYDTYTLTTYIAKTIRVKMNVDIAFHNTGGTRTDIKENEVITEGKLYQILPFDNQIIILTMYGSDVQRLMGGYNRYDIDPNISIESNQIYKVAVHSYIYGDGSRFYNALSYELTKYYIRDVFIEMVKLQASIYNRFDINDPVILPEKMDVKRNHYLF